MATNIGDEKVASTAIAGKAVQARSDSIVAKDTPMHTPDLEPTWEVFRPMGSLVDNPTFLDTMKTTRKTLKTVSKTLQDVLALIESARAVLKLVAIFESVFKNLLYTFLNTLLDQLQRMLNDAKSTGVYVIDLVSYHWIKTSDTANVDDNDYLATIANGPWYSMSLADKIEKQSEKPGLFSQIGNLLQAVDQSYKRENYSQFIETIVDAFEDTNDVPSGAMAYSMSPFDDSSFYDYEYEWRKDPSGHRRGIEVVTSKTLKEKDRKTFGLNVPNFFQSGRPDFGEQAYMKVYLIAYCMPDVGQVVKLLKNMYGLLGNLIPFGKMWDALEQATKADEKVSNIEDNNPFKADARKLEKPVITNTNEKKADKDLFAKASDAVSDEVNAIANEFHKVFGVVTAPAQEPNFYGINMYTLFAPYFDILQSLLNTCRSWANKELPGVGGLIEMLESWLTDLEEQINKLLDLIAMIENFLRLIEMILNITGLRILSFDTKDGIPGVVKALRRSRNFGEENQDKKLINEKVRAQSAEKNIREQKAISDDYVKELADLKLRQDHLNKLHAIVLDWNTYILSQGLSTKQTALNNATIYWDNLIQTEQSKIDTIQDAHEDIIGIVYLKAVLYDNYDIAINGQTLGGEYYPGYAQQIIDVTDARDTLIAQHNDPSNPDIEDYQSKIDAYNNQITLLTNLSTDTTNTYNYENDNYTWVQSNITSDPYSTQLSDASAAFIVLKNDNDPAYSGSAAEAFQNSILADEALLVIYNNDIVDLNAEVVTVNDTKNLRRTEIYAYDSYAYTIKAEDYTVATMPPITDPAPWNDVVFRNLFLNSTDGYFYCVGRLTDIPNEIIALQLLVTNTEQDIIDTQSDWDIYSIDSIESQKRYTIMKSVLTREIQIEGYELTITNLNHSKDLEVIAKNLEINNIIKNGWNNYLSDTVIYYKETVPYSKDGVLIGTWTDNEIGYLIFKDKYDMHSPVVINNQCLPIVNALTYIDAEIAVNLKNGEAALSAYNEAVKEEEAAKEAQVVEEGMAWDPAAKMYYGGFLFCYGWPLDLQSRATKDITTLYKDNFQDPLLSETSVFNQQVSDLDASKKVGQFLNWVFK